MAPALQTEIRSEENMDISDDLSQFVVAWKGWFLHTLLRVPRA